MKKALLAIVTLALAVSSFSMVIETEEGRKEREAKIAQIESLFDFDIVSATIHSLKSDTKSVNGVELESAELTDEWTPHVNEYNSEYWWLSYEGGNKCFLTVYFMEDTKEIHPNGDTALTFVYELEFDQKENEQKKVIKLAYKSHTTSNGFMWISP